MRGRLLVVLVVLLIAGCSAPSAAPSVDAETVTPVPVPDSGDSVSGVENGAVDGSRLGAAHAATLENGHTRTVVVGVAADDGRYLSYRETLTVGGSGEMLRTRVYEGQGTARFVPDRADATSARSERYVGGIADDVRVQYRTVDDRTLRTYGAGGAPPLVSPIPPLGYGPLAAALLGDATIVERTESGGVRLSADTVDDAAVPDYLAKPRNVTVEATVRADGRITHVSVRYVATLVDGAGTVEGDSVVVVQDVYWSPPSEPVAPPEPRDERS